ncbi:hypothetical protein [Paenibacillus cymbidii]|nr:hypothetical protein [Paenibacillus cymbidii]
MKYTKPEATKVGNIMEITHGSGSQIIEYIIDPDTGYVYYETYS